MDRVDPMLSPAVSGWPVWQGWNLQVRFFTCTGVAAQQVMAQQGW
jgi:hypothetical protein